MLALARSRAAIGRTASRSMSASVTPAFNKRQFREPDPNKPKIVLAYSGGLDTSCQLSLVGKGERVRGLRVHRDLGQDDCRTEEDKEEIARKAEMSGAYAFYCEDLKKDFVENYVFKSIRGNALYEGRYLLGTSVARPCIGKRQVEICWAEGARHISHVDQRARVMTRCASNCATLEWTPTLSA